MNSEADRRQIVRIFLSSPFDVRSERVIAEQVVRRMSREFAHHFDIEAMVWEREPLVATETFQDGIPSPADADIVVTILWSRLGVFLPAGGYRGAVTGKAPVTGTEWEFEQAVRANREHGRPHLLVYRKIALSMLPEDDPEAMREATRQRADFEGFFSRWFGDTSGFRGAWHGFEDATELVDKLETHLRELLRRRLPRHGREGDRPVRWVGGSPFRGLQSFEAEHAPIFFGRERDRSALRQALVRRAEKGSAFVLVLGASGSGKSSLLKAGLIHDLGIPGMVERIALCRAAVVRPADCAGDLVAGLCAAISTTLPEAAELSFADPALALARIESGVRAAAAASKLTALGEARLLVVVDQLEEIFTLDWVDDLARERFAGALAELARAGRGRLVWIVGSMRSDFYHRLEQVRELVALAEGDGQYHLMPPHAEEIGEIIRRPAIEAGLAFESDDGGSRLDAVLEDAARKDPQALPLLEFTLDELYKRRSADGFLTSSAYEEIGGLEGSIGRRAEEVYRALDLAEREAFPTLIRSLVTAAEGEESAPTTRTVALEVAAPRGTERRAVADALVAARLLVTDQQAGGPVIRLAHEALLARWPRVRDLLERDRQFLQARGRVGRAARLWADEGRNEERLLPAGRPLAEAADMLAGRRDELEPAVIEYVRASVAAAEKRQRRRTRLTRMVAAALGVLAVAALISAFQAHSKRLEAESARRDSEAQAEHAREQRDAAQETESRLLTAESDRWMRAGKPIRAAAVALAALPATVAQPERVWFQGAWRALSAALEQNRLTTVLVGHRGPVTAVAFSPDGSRVATAGMDGTMRVWSTDSGLETLRIRAHPAVVWDVTFSPDGQRIATASEDGTVRVWNASTGERLLALAGHHDWVRSVAYSPDGRRIAAASEDSTARLWDAATGRPEHELRGHRSGVNCVAFSPSGDEIATASDDQTVRLWSVGTGRMLRSLEGHQGAVNSVAFAPSGSGLLTASEDGTARYWTLGRGVEPVVFREHSGPVIQGRISPDGNYAVTASADGSARVWTTQAGRGRFVLGDHGGEVLGLAFSPDGKTIATSARDGRAKLWDAHARTIEVADPPPDAALPVQFSPDGRTLLITAVDWHGQAARATAVDARAPIKRHARLFAWDVEDERVLFTAAPDRQIILSPFSADGAWLGLNEGLTLRVIDARTGRVTRSFEHSIDGAAPKDGSISFAEIDPKAEWASASYAPWRMEAANEWTTSIWDMRTGRERARIRGFRSTMQNGLSGLGVSPDGTRLAGFAGDRPMVVATVNGQTLLTLPAHRSLTGGMAFSPDGRKLLTVDRDAVLVWDAASGERLATLRTGQRNDQSMAHFSPDGRWIVVIPDGRRGTQPIVWNTERYEQLNVAPLKSSWAEFLPDGDALLTTQVTDARIWNAATGDELAVFADSEGVADVVGMPGESAAAEPRNNDESGAEALPFWNGLTPVTQDGRYVASGWSGGHYVRLWRAPGYRSHQDGIDLGRALLPAPALAEERASSTASETQPPAMPTERPATANQAAAAELEAEARRGDPAAMRAFGEAIHGGRDGWPDARRAVAWWAKAAAAGDARALVLLGRSYEAGTGVEQDPVRATLYTRAAAARGEPSAHLALAEADARAGRREEAYRSAAIAGRLARSAGESEVENRALALRYNLGVRLGAKTVIDAWREAVRWAPAMPPLPPIALDHPPLDRPRPPEVTGADDLIATLEEATARLAAYGATVWIERPDAAPAPWARLLEARSPACLHSAGPVLGRAEVRNEATYCPARYGDIVWTELQLMSPENFRAVAGVRWVDFGVFAMSRFAKSLVESNAEPRTFARVVHGAPSVCVERRDPPHRDPVVSFVPGKNPVFECRDVARAVVCVDRETRLPTLIELWGGGNRLLSRYIYGEYVIDPDVGPLDFSFDNPQSVLEGRPALVAVETSRRRSGQPWITPQPIAEQGCPDRSVRDH